MSILEDIGGLSNPFGSPSKGEWNLTKGIYVNGDGDELVFFVEQRKGENKQAMTGLDQITDSGGRRLAIYEYPYIDGQKVDDLGRKGETHTFNMKFHGSDYQRILRQFEQVVVNSSKTGTLTHPVLSATRGSLNVRLSTYELLHRHDEFNSVTIKCSFIEDNTGAIELRELAFPPVDSALKAALQTLADAKAFISEKLFEVTALLTLPAQILAAQQQSLDSIVGQVSRLIGQVSATFSPTSNTTNIAANAGALNKNIIVLSSGTTTEGNVLPPVYQSGFNAETQTQIDQLKENFINANQITPQQAVFNANQSRASIGTTIKTVERDFGNQGYDIVLTYRDLAISVQTLTEIAISSSRSKVKVYIVPNPMSLRMIAKNNGLSPDRQNDIESLNPYLPSVNYIAKGSRILVPAA